MKLTARLPTANLLYVPLVVGIALLLLVALYPAVSWDLFPQMLLFIFLIVVASFLIVQNPAGGVLSSTPTLFYIVLYVFNPITALVVVALGYAIGNTLPRTWVTWRTCFNGSQMGLSVFLGGVVYRTLGGTPSAPLDATQLLPVLMGPVIHQIANNFFIAFPISRERNVRFFRTWVEFVRDFFWSNLLSIPAAVLIAVLYVRVHHAFALIFLASLPFQRWAVKLYLEKRNTYRRIIERFVRAGELSLPETKGHAQRVAGISLAIGRRLGLVDRELEAIEYAALLHDIGLIGIDDLINSEDYRDNTQHWIEAHARDGAEVVNELERPEISEMVRNHHTPFRRTLADEVFESSGLSIGARIIALAEEVDSRLHGLFPHRQASSPETVLRFIGEARGRQFDPQVVDAFFATLKDSAAADYLLKDRVLGTVQGVTNAP